MDSTISPRWSCKCVWMRIVASMREWRGKRQSTSLAVRNAKKNSIEWCREIETEWPRKRYLDSISHKSREISYGYLVLSQSYQSQNIIDEITLSLYCFVHCAYSIEGIGFVWLCSPSRIKLAWDAPTFTTISRWIFSCFSSLCSSSLQHSRR